ncbi:DEAD/DEAH box helicase [Paenalkalicoccus suaedae]|uniref:DEAD/DEAH box helicase n=1 Tax=Paenalkalicoccus suaedae TaxID=2592382 RepID=A0A859FCZ7_9BACI|nr:SNF2-related protein [Paenalkalicoccus suaedae]QKS70937.1 DEAD/DEAH box helicase [Paenalkalicoccus suaedae]
MIDVLLKDSLSEKLTDQHPITTWDQFTLAYDINEALHNLPFDGIVSLSHLPNVTLHDYQLDACKRVLFELNGSALLADEVGLGKTIEAGLILKEYMHRNIVKKVLILCPASLVSQWGEELRTKFLLPAYEKRKGVDWETYDIIISSMELAKREPNREAILAINYDMIIIDEAHKLKNHQSRNHQFVQQLKKKFCLLLTATPMQNKVKELIHLVSILRPGLLSASHEKSLTDDQMKALVKSVMIRTRRKDTSIEWPKRIVSTTLIDFSPEETQVYEKLDDLQAVNSLLSLTLRREWCSSKFAALTTMVKALKEEKLEDTGDLQELLAAMQQVDHHAKAKEVLNQIKSWGSDKVLIFTEYRATQLYLQAFLTQAGYICVPFRGGFKRGKKEWMKQVFKDRAQIMIATEAGNEGVNLQFCNRLINYDLPWNPMRIEQRIGRLHRHGQSKDVTVVHVAVKETIEDHLLSLLYKKIGLFEGVVGEVDTILEDVARTDIESYMTQTFTKKRSTSEIKLRLEHLSHLLEEERHDAN